MNNKVIRELQEYHYCLRDANGHWRKEPIGFIYNCKTSEENLSIIRKILTIILDSDYMAVETKIFISSKGISIRDINQFINDARAMKLNKEGKILKPLSYNNTCIKLREDDNTLDQYLGVQLLRGIVTNRDDNKKETNKQLNKFKNRFAYNELYRDNLLLSIDNRAPKVNGYKNNEEFFDMLSSLEAYLVQRKDIIQQAINSNTDFVEYFNYLLSSKALDDESVATDRERLIKFLKNEDYVTGYENGVRAEEETEEDFSSSNLRQLKPEDVKVNDGGDIDLNNYAAWSYDLPMNKN